MKNLWIEATYLLGDVLAAILQEKMVNRSP
jgi:hypothetical protein